METSLTVALQLLGFEGPMTTIPPTAWARLPSQHVLSVARDYKLHVGVTTDAEYRREEVTDAKPQDIDDEEKLRIMNRALMRHGMFIDRVRPDIDLTASAADITGEPGWRLEPMP